MFFVSNTINNEEFNDFIKLLEYWLLKLNIDIKSQVVFVLDNASHHSSAKTIELLLHQKICVENLPPYCPTQALVETLLKFIKSGVKKLSKQKPINFSKPIGVEIIGKIIHKLQMKQGMKHRFHLWEKDKSQLKLLIMLQENSNQLI